MSLALSRQSSVSGFVATKSGFVATKFCPWLFATKFVSGFVETKSGFFESQQSFVIAFVATKSGFVTTNLCPLLCHDIVFAQQLVFLLQLVGATTSLF